MKTLFTILIIAFTLKCDGQTSDASSKEISGIITYSLNKDNGDKADIGAHVYIFDSISNQDFNLSLIDTFCYASAFRDIANSYSSIPKSLVIDLKNFHAYKQKDFDSLDHRSFRNIHRALNSKSCLKTTVDDNGHYSLKAKPGVYYIYIESSHIKDISMMEVDGKIFCKRVIIEGENIEISQKFTIL